MFIKMLLNALSNIWPMIFIFTIIVVSLRLFYLAINKQKFVLRKELLMLCFVVYILLLYYVVTFQDNNYGTNNWIPFKEIFRYNITSRLFIKNVFGNILLFIPFGIFTPYILKNKTVFPIAFLGLLVSCAIEFAQMSIGRTADVDDVILNTIGTIIGYIIFYLINSFANKVPGFMKKDIILDGIAVIITALLMYVLYRLLLGGINIWTM